LQENFEGPKPKKAFSPKKKLPKRKTNLSNQRLTATHSRKQRIKKQHKYKKQEALTGEK
jgi:hypothetical protein